MFPIFGSFKQNFQSKVLLYMRNSRIIFDNSQLNVKSKTYELQRLLNDSHFIIASTFPGQP